MHAVTRASYHVKITEPCRRAIHQIQTYTQHCIGLLQATGPRPVVQACQAPPMQPTQLYTQAYRPYWEPRPSVYVLQAYIPFIVTLYKAKCKFRFHFFVQSDHQSTACCLHNPGSCLFCITICLYNLRDILPDITQTVSDTVHRQK